MYLYALVHYSPLRRADLWRPYYPHYPNHPLARPQEQGAAAVVRVAAAAVGVGVGMGLPLPLLLRREGGCRRCIGSSVAV